MADGQEGSKAGRRPDPPGGEAPPWTRRKSGSQGLWAGAAAGLACLWGLAVARAAPDPQAPDVPDAPPGQMSLRLDATGALAASLAEQAPADDAHLCATLALPGGRQDTLLRFGADPDASVLDPARPGLVLTIAGQDDAPPAGPASHDLASHDLAPRDGSVQASIGGQTFFGSTQPGAPFRLSLSVLPGQAGGRFVASHLTDRSGQQAIDLAGAWRCPAPPTAVAAADPAPADIPRVPLPPADPQPPAPVPVEPEPPAAPALPPATAFRQLLTQLDQAAPQQPPPAPPEPPRPDTRPALPRPALPRPALAPPAPLPSVLPGPALPRVAVQDPEFAGRRVFIHYRAGSQRGSAVADDLARTLDPQFARTVIRTVAATPGDAQIRFFHAQDAAAAGALARTLGGANSPWHVKAFTNAANGTEPGLLEVWIPER